jgi:hypothetical protein
METTFPRDKASRGADPAQLGKEVWGVLHLSWTLKENGSGVESPKPLYLN